LDEWENSGPIQITEEHLALVSQYVKEHGDEILRAVATASQGITDPIGQVAKWLYDRLTEVGSWIASAVEAAVRSIVSGIASAISAARTVIDSIAAAVSRIPETVSSIVSRAVSLASDAILTVVRGVHTAITSLLDSAFKAISSGLVALRDAVISAFSSAIGGVLNLLDTIRGVISSGLASLSGALSNLWSWIQSGLAATSSVILGVIGNLSSMVSQSFTSIRDILATVWQSVSAGIGSILNAVRETGETLYGGIRWMFEGVKEGFGRISDMVVSGFKSLADSFGFMVEQLSKFAEHVSGLGAMIMGGISNIASALASIPNVVSEAFGSVIEFYNRMLDSIKSFISDPVGWFRTNIIEPVWQGLLWVGERIWESLQWLWGQMVSGAEWVVAQMRSLFGWLVSTAQNVMATIVEAVSGAFLSIASTFSSIASNLRDAILGLFTSLMGLVRGVLVEKFFTPILDSIRSSLSSLGVSSPKWTEDIYLKRLDETLSYIPVQMMAGYILMGALFKILGYITRGAAFAIGHLVKDVQVTAKPLGLGAHITVELGYAIGSVLHNLGEMLADAPEFIAKNIIQGISIWFAQPISRVMLYGLSDYLPMNIPEIRYIVEILRRSSVAEVLPDVVSSKEEVAAFSEFYLHLMMYPSFFRKMVVERDDRFHVKVRDRFQVERRIPLSLRYTLPSAREVVRWLIRDVIIPPVLERGQIEDNIRKLLGMRGYSEDVAKLYYISNFRYPPPTALARFYWRAMARVLWLPESLEEREIADVINAPYRSLPPVELNKNPRVVMDAIYRYWRWHDYAPFTWYPDFTTDKAIMVELTADLPRRIDLRWMTRWGIIQHAGFFAARMDEPILDVLTRAMGATGAELRSDYVTPEISLDVRLLARLYQATGYHPYFAPFIAVAHAHHVIAEEMTLTRTGFISAFREGVTSLDTMEKLMSGMFIITFKTGMVDPSTAEWREFEYRKPLFWLPAERRLLQMRSVFDRYVDLWRDFMREVVTGIRRLALLPESGLELMKRFFEYIRDRWASDIRRITGVDWAPELDEAYLNMWVEYASLTRLIEARVWVRHYISRVMGWLLYRISYGWVRPSDFERFISDLQRSGWLTEEESKFFVEMFGSFYGLISREYIPTPLTLATFAEYMDIGEEVISNILTTYNVPEEYRQLYATYISIKPVKSDYKALLTAYRRALIRGVVGRDVWESKLEEARSYGFSDREIRILEELAELEELMDRSKERVPTPSTLATLAEYVEVGPDIIESTVRAYRLAEEYASLFARYIYVKPVKSDFKTLINRATRAYVQGVMGRDEWESILAQAGDYGFTKREIEIIQRVAEIDQLMEMSKERVPTPMSLTTLAEYMVVDPGLVEKSVRAYRVDEEFARLYTEYIRTRPVKSDFRALLSVYRRAFVRGVIPEDEWSKVLEEARSYGFTPIEVEILRRIADVEYAIESSRERVPSPTALATLAEYMAVPAELVEKSIQAYRLDPAYSELIRRYVTVRPVKGDYRSLLTVLRRALRLNVVTPDVWSRYLEAAREYGFTDAEISILQAVADIEQMIQDAVEYVPTPSTLVTLAEYTYVPPELVTEALTIRRVREPWFSLWTRAVYARVVSDDVRVLLSSYYRAVRYGVSIPKDIEDFVRSMARSAGVMEDEMRIRDLAAAIDQMVETVPSLSQLAAMAEYVAVPMDYVAEVLARRRVERRFADLWVRYIQVRTISSEVNRVVSVFQRMYERFAVPEVSVSYVRSLMEVGGWTASEIEIWNFELNLRRQLRVLMTLIPTLRQFVYDAQYLPRWGTLFEDLLRAYGIDAATYKAQADYYRALVKNRRLWRHFSWYRSQLMYAYGYGVITIEKAAEKLSKFKDLGLIDDDEISVILDGFELYRARLMAARAR